MITVVAVTYGLVRFFIPSMLMGGGIAVDVSLATVTKFRDRTLSWKNWTAPIMTTHILFPAVGYYLFYGLGREFKSLSPVLGIVGFLFVLAFVYEVTCEAIGTEPLFGISAWFSGLVGLEEDDIRRHVAILAVSWDALWSGPAKAAQASAGHWSKMEVALSFVVAGLTVALIAQVSLLIAQGLRKKNFQSATKMAKWFFWGKLVELSVIGGFGVLSLSEALTGEGNLYLSILIAATTLSLVWGRFYREIRKSSLEEATEAVASTSISNTPLTAVTAV